MGQADIYTIATAGLEDGSGPGIPSSAVDKVLQYVERVLFERATTTLVLTAGCIAYRRLGDFSDSINWKEFIVLLLSLEGEDVLQAVQLLFEVFSDEGDCSLEEPEFMELFTPFAARDRLMKGVDGFVEKLTVHLQET